MVCFANFYLHPIFQPPELLQRFLFFKNAFGQLAGHFQRIGPETVDPDVLIVGLLIYPLAFSE